MALETPIPPPETELERVGYSRVLKNGQFMALWVAQIFCQFADRAVFVLFVAVLTVAQTHNARLADTGAAEMTSFLYVAFTIPAIILSPIAGVYVDRWSQRAVMILSNILRALFVALVAFPAVSKSVWSVFGLAFMSSVATQFFGPAESASIPRLVKKEDLYAANSLFFTTMMIALGFGFAIGEPIISSVGFEKAPWAVAALFAISAVLLLFIGSSQTRLPEKDVWWEELRFGLAYIANNVVVFRAILKMTILFSTIITLNVVAVGLAQQVLHILPHQFGYIVAAAGAGMGIGNFWVGHYGQKFRHNNLVYSGFSLLGLFLCLLGSLGFIQQYVMNGDAWHGWWMTIPLGLAGLTGASCAMVAVPTAAQLQSVVPEELRGKVFGAQNTAMSAASTIPAVLAGALIDNLPGGVSTTLLLMGLPTMITGIYHLARCSRAPTDNDLL
jgi:MFS family permease